MAGIALPYFGSTAGKQSQPDPNQLPSLNLWYNASANTTNVNGVIHNNFNVAVTHGTNVSAWKDLSGTGHDANVTGGGGPQPDWQASVYNNNGSLRFVSANSDNVDINPIAWSQNLSGFTMYVAARPTSYSSLFPLAVNDTNLGIKFDGTYMCAGATGIVGQAQNWNKDPNRYNIFGMCFDGTKVGNSERLKFRINGEAQTLNYSGTVGTTTNASSSYFFVGGESRSGITLGYMDGYIGEVMIWTRALNFAEQLGVESYLTNKWGLLKGLPLSPIAVSSGLQLYYDPATGYSGSGTSLTDLSGNNYTGTIVNSPSYTGGTGGYFTYDSGSSQYIRSPNMASSFNSTSAFTVEVWYAPNYTVQGAGGTVLTENGTTDPATGWRYSMFEHRKAPFGSLAYDYAAVYTGSVTAVNPTATFNNNVWRQQILTYDGTNGRIYTNGTLGLTKAATRMTPWSQGWTEYYLMMGAGCVTQQSGAGTNYFTGKIGIVRAYNRALTASEITTNYNNTKSIYGL